MKPIQILLQTIPTAEDDWSIARSSLLHQYLESLKHEDDSLVCEVVSRDRQSDANGDDPVLSTLDQSDFDELRLFAGEMVVLSYRSHCACS